MLYKKFLILNSSFLIFLFLSCSPSVSENSCRSCHQMTISHKASCVDCHLGNATVSKKESAHSGLISIPGNLSNVEATCGKCHLSETHRISKSIMTTNSGMIAVNRWVFGESRLKDNNLNLHTLQTEKSPADSYFSQQCASCHLGADKKKGEHTGYEKGGGCLACHLELSNKETHPILVKTPKDESCFNCHSRSSRISLNYNGLVEMDENDTSIPARILYDGRRVKQIQEDIHKTKGLTCVTCHKSLDVMGDGNEHLHKEDSVYVKCESCHNSISDKNHKTNHERVSCTACHSAWAPNCFGCHISYDSTKEGYNHLTQKTEKGRWIEEAGEMFIKPSALGVTKDNKIRPFIPGMKLTIDKSGFTGKKDKLITKNLFAPSFSHTITKQGRSCQSCHNSSYTLGFGEGKIIFDKNSFRFISDYKKINRLPEDAWIIPQTEYNNKEELSVRTGARSLNSIEQQKILNVGKCLVCHKESESLFLNFEKFKSYIHKTNGNEEMK